MRPQQQGPEASRPSSWHVRHVRHVIPRARAKLGRGPALESNGGEGLRKAANRRFLELASCRGEVRTDHHARHAVADGCSGNVVVWYTQVSCG